MVQWKLTGVTAAFRETLDKRRGAAVTDSESLGDAAQVEILTVDLFDETETAGVYKATRRTYSVIPDECGSGVDTLIYTGTLKAVSAPAAGTFVLSTETFTEN